MLLLNYSHYSVYFFCLLILNRFIAFLLALRALVVELFNEAFLHWGVSIQVSHDDYSGGKDNEVHVSTISTAEPACGSQKGCGPGEGC